MKGVPRVGGQPDQILDTQVKQAVDSQIAAKGLTEAADRDKADLVLGYQLAIDREKQINGFADGWRGWGGWGPCGGGLNSSRDLLLAQGFIEPHLDGVISTRRSGRQRAALVQETRKER